MAEAWSWEVGAERSRTALAVPLAALLVAVVLSLPALDLAITRCFHRPDGWTLEGTTFARVLYRWGTWPALAIAAVAMLVAASSFVTSRWRPSRCAAVAVVLALAIGPGLIVNLALKEHWGRPRPRDVAEFGGAQPYRPAFAPGPGHFTSFCSGHVATAAFTCVLFFVWRRRRPRAALGALAATAGYTTAMAVARVGVGAHFPSDAAWAAAISAGVGYAADLTLLRTALSGTTAAGSPSPAIVRPACAAR